MKQTLDDQPDSSPHSVPCIRTELPGPRAAAWIARDERFLSPSYTRPYPLVAARGEGCMIEDVDGNRFLDMTAGLAVTSTGHAHPDVVAALREQAGQLLHLSGTDFHYAPQIELAERLARLFPGNIEARVFFANSGAEAVEAALKLARWHTARSRIIAFEGAFHGRTFGAMSLSASKAIHRRGFAPLVEGIFHLPFDCQADDFERLFATRVAADEVAAIFVEPIQGEGGYRVPRPGFLPMLRRIADKHGILLVADEVQTGVGRTGRMLAIEHFGVVPDMVCLAKGLASGMPLGALITRAEVMDWPPGSHASTFGGNPLSCRAALATLDLVEDDLKQNAHNIGRQLFEGLAALAQRRRDVSAPRGLGLMLAVDCLAKGTSPDPARRDRVVQAAFERGLLLVGCGQAAIRFCPPLCITEDEATIALNLFEEAVTVVAEQAE